jgi:hypothetical protein
MPDGGWLIVATITPSAMEHFYIRIGDGLQPVARPA